MVILVIRRAYKMVVEAHSLHPMISRGAPLLVAIFLFCNYRRVAEKEDQRMKNYLSISSEARMKGPIPLGSLSRIGSER